MSHPEGLGMSELVEAVAALRELRHLAVQARQDRLEHLPLPDVSVHHQHLGLPSHHLLPLLSCRRRLAHRRLAPAESLCDLGRQLVLGHGLADEVGHARLLELGLVVRRIWPDDPQDNGRVRARSLAGPHLLARVPARHVRHEPVEEDHVVAHLGCLLHRLCPVVHRVHLVLVPRQHRPQHHPMTSVVIDHQDPQLGAASSWAGRLLRGGRRSAGGIGGVAAKSLCLGDPLADLGRELVPGDGLEDRVGHPSLLALLLVIAGGSGDSDDRDGPSAARLLLSRSDLCRRLPPCLVGHEPVHQHRVVLHLLHRLHRLRPILCRVHLEAVLGQHRSKHSPLPGVIIHHQDPLLPVQVARVYRARALAAMLLRAAGIERGVTRGLRVRRCLGDGLLDLHPIEGPRDQPIHPRLRALLVLLPLEPVDDADQDRSLPGSRPSDVSLDLLGHLAGLGPQQLVVEDDTVVREV
eukprot:555049-Hanusia_phi.AAC.1